MKIVFSFLIISGATFVFAACGVCDCRKVPCNAFNDPLFDEWFPYNEGQKVYFKSTLNEIESISIDYIYRSDAYEGRKGCVNGDIGCKSNINVSSNEIINTSFRKFDISYGNDQPFSGNSSSTIQIIVLGSVFQGTGINEKGIIPDSAGAVFKTTNFATIILSNKQFNNVQVIEWNVGAGFGAHKIYLARNIGMVAYESYPDDKLWVKE